MHASTSSSAMCTVRVPTADSLERRLSQAWNEATTLVAHPQSALGKVPIGLHGQTGAGS